MLFLLSSKVGARKKKEKETKKKEKETKKKERFLGFLETFTKQNN